MNKNNCGCAMMHSMKNSAHTKSKSPVKKHSNKSRSRSRSASRKMRHHQSRSRSRSASRERLHRMHQRRSRSRSASRERHMRKLQFLQNNIPMIPSMSGMSYVADEWADVTNINCDQNITGYARMGATWPSCHGCNDGQIQRRC